MKIKTRPKDLMKYSVKYRRNRVIDDTVQVILIVIYIVIFFYLIFVV